MPGGSMCPEYVLKLWHYDKAYNDDFTYNNFTYNGNTSSPAIQLANFLFIFLLLYEVIYMQIQL